MTNDDCGATGPRGAAEESGGSDLTATDADLERQQAKIVAAINALDADVVSLEEIENTVVVTGGDRDTALRTLVTALNAAAGADRWAFAPSPAPADLPAVVDQDVIRTAFIYNPSTVELVGDSEVLTDAPAFDNAREPLAQAFRPVGGSTVFAVVVNHFKSKSSGTEDGTGQGSANPERVAQAEALVPFASSFAESRGTDSIFLVGDFNSYSMEDPLQVLYRAGFDQVASDEPDEWSYSFSGLSGSLDHVLGNAGAAALVTGADIWGINAVEPVALEYSRHNYNATNFYRPDVYRASDHDPILVGLDLPGTQDAPVTLTAAADPARVRALTGRSEVTVTATAAEGTPAGLVEIFDGDRVIGSGDLVDGSATIRVGPFDSTGVHNLTVRYTGAEGFADTATSVSLRVTKAVPRLTVTTRPASPFPVTRRPLVVARLRSPGSVTGRVVVTSAGVTRRGRVEDGLARVRLPRYRSPGRYRILVRYAGDGLHTKVRSAVRVRVTRR